MRVHAALFPGRTEREIVLPDGATGLELLRALGRPPDVHILARGDTPVPLDTPLEDGERVRVISVVSGGLA